MYPPPPRRPLLLTGAPVTTAGCRVFNPRGGAEASPKLGRDRGCLCGCSEADAGCVGSTAMQCPVGRHASRAWSSDRCPRCHPQWTRGAHADTRCSSWRVSSYYF